MTCSAGLLHSLWAHHALGAPGRRCRVREAAWTRPGPVPSYFCTTFERFSCTMPLALLALAVVAFGIGTTEFATMGLLPQIADGIGVSVPHAGNVVSAYALGVVVGAPLLTGICARVPHKRLLLLLTGLFVVGNTASALAPDFGTLFAARFLAGLPHGALFGVGAVVASRLVAADRAARAVSKMFLGLT